MKRLAIYAHYDTRDRVSIHGQHYLKELRDLGFKVCLVSNSPIRTDCVGQLEGVCDQIIQRENRGFDFAMWKEGLDRYRLDEFDELLLTNSSLIGPLSSLKRLWSDLSLDGCDFWGLTDNEEIAVHLQSYFLVFNREVIQSPCFLEFWKGVLPYGDKDQAIRSYEVGLTLWLEQHGFKWKAVYPRERVYKEYLQSRTILRKIHDRITHDSLPGRNTSLIYPDVLLALGMPFLKQSLLKYSNSRFQPKSAFALLKASNLPAEMLEELQTCFPECRS